MKGVVRVIVAGKDGAEQLRTYATKEVGQLEGKSNKCRVIRKFGNPRRKKGEVWTNTKE